MKINPYKEKSDEAWEDGVNFWFLATFSGSVAR